MASPVQYTGTGIPYDAVLNTNKDSIVYQLATTAGSSSETQLAIQNLGEKSYKHNRSFLINISWPCISWPWSCGENTCEQEGQLLP
jgi:hypothetical protein